MPSDSLPAVLVALHLRSPLPATSCTISPRRTSTTYRTKYVQSTYVALSLAARRRAACRSAANSPLRSGNCGLFVGLFLDLSLFPSCYSVGASTACVGRHNPGEKKSRRECVRSCVCTTVHAFTGACSLCSNSSGHESLDFMCGLLCLRIPEELLPADVLDRRRRWGGLSPQFLIGGYAPAGRHGT